MYGGASEEGLNDQSIYFLRNYLSKCEHTKRKEVGPWQRRFIAPVEEKEMLERYKDFLKNELAGLEARLKEVEA
jgi:hypothetical protein